MEDRETVPEVTKFTYFQHDLWLKTNVLNYKGNSVWGPNMVGDSYEICAQKKEKNKSVHAKIITLRLNAINKCVLVLLED
jgi:hypothetical protein